MKLTEICSWRIEDQVLRILCLALIIFLGEIFQPREVCASSQVWHLFLNVSIETSAGDLCASWRTRVYLVGAHRSSWTANLLILGKRLKCDQIGGVVWFTCFLKAPNLYGMHLHWFRRLENHSLKSQVSLFSIWHFFLDTGKSKNISELEVFLRTDIL